MTLHHSTRPAARGAGLEFRVIPSVVPVLRSTPPSAGPARSRSCLLALCLLLLVMVPGARAYTVTGNLVGLGLTAINTPVTFTPTNNPQSMPPLLEVGPTIIVVPSAGYFSTNLAPGGYTVKIPPYQFGIAVPTGTGTNDISLLGNGSLITYTYTNPVGTLQPASANLTNWSGRTTNSFVPSTNGGASGLASTNQTNYSGIVLASGTYAGDGSGITNQSTNGMPGLVATLTNLQPASPNLTNWSARTTNGFVASASGIATNLFHHGILTSSNDITGNQVYLSNGVVVATGSAPSYFGGDLTVHNTFISQGGLQVYDGDFNGNGGAGSGSFLFSTTNSGFGDLSGAIALWFDAFGFNQDNRNNLWFERIGAPIPLMWWTNDGTSIGLKKVFIGPNVTNTPAVGKQFEVSGDGQFDNNLLVSGTITGNGSGLTSIPNSALSSQSFNYVTNQTTTATTNLALLNGTNTFSGVNNFSNNANTFAGASFTGPSHGAATAIGLNIGGTNTTINGGASTGTGKGGAVVLQTTFSGASSSSANPLTTRYYCAPHAVTVRTNNTAELICTVTVASGKWFGGTLEITTYADNGTDFQATTSMHNLGAVNKAGTVTGNAGVSIGSNTASSSGTLANSVTTAPNGSGLDIRVTANSSLTPTTEYVTWQLFLNSNDTPTITAQ